MLWLRNYLKIVFPASTDNGFDVAMLVQTQTSQQEYNNCLTVSGKGPFINVPDDGLRLRWNVELKIFSLFVAVTNQILIEDVLQEVIKGIKSTSGKISIKTTTKSNGEKQAHVQG